ncbi:MAG: hypothetical protein R3F19_18675 [Verrucomicrobiales bacterium]
MPMVTDFTKCRTPAWHSSSFFFQVGDLGSVLSHVLHVSCLRHFTPLIEEIIHRFASSHATVFGETSFAIIGVEVLMTARSLIYQAVTRASPAP